RLDASSVVERMRELVGANPQFDEARALMEECIRLLRESGSEPPTPLTPRPGSLFPSAPPVTPPPPSLETSDTAVFSVSPLDDVTIDSFSDTDEPPESWPVPGFESGDTLLDEERPTFVPEPPSLEAPNFDDSYPAASLAATEYPGAESEPPAGLAVSRELRVDTRDSLVPRAASLLPPSRY